MALAPVEWTVEELLAIPNDGRRREVIDGELFVSPAQRFHHQRACDELMVRLMAYCHPKRLGVVLSSPADVILDDRTLIQPDVFVSELVNGRQPSSWREVRLLLAAEVLSPSSRDWDRINKRRRLQVGRVPEFWIVDVDARVVERWCPDDSTAVQMKDRLVWSPVAGIEPLVVDLKQFFAIVFDERP